MDLLDVSSSGNPPAMQSDLLDTGSSGQARIRTARNAAVCNGRRGSLQTFEKIAVRILDNR